MTISMDTETIAAFERVNERIDALEVTLRREFRHGLSELRAELRSELADVRRWGWAEAAGEREPDLAALAAPVFGRDGGLVAILGLQGPVARLPAEKRAALSEPLVAAAGVEWSTPLAESLLSRRGMVKAVALPLFCTFSSAAACAVLFPC